MPGIVQRHLRVLTSLLVFMSGVCAFAQAPIVEEPNYKPTLTFDVAVIRLAPPPETPDPLCSNLAAPPGPSVPSGSAAPRSRA